MDLFHAMKSKRHNKLENLHLYVFGFRDATEKLAIIKVPNYRVLKLMMTLALLLSLVIVLSLPWINILIVDPPPPPPPAAEDAAAGRAAETNFPGKLGLINRNPNQNPLIQLLFHDLANEGGLLKKLGGDRALFVTGGSNDAAVIRNREAAAGRPLLGISPKTDKAKKAAALRNLEDVLLEPPRSASGKSKRYFKRTRYLPDLIGDSLESYRRRVFINVHLSGNDDVTTNDPNWFSDHYPTRNKKFEIFNIETVPVQGKTSSILSQVVGMSDWLKINVQENEYVVMKAEAEVVEEMITSGAIKLVDELFLECKHQGIKKGCKRSRRAYWECLALYGMLRDEGVAVHQWWG